MEIQSKNEPIPVVAGDAVAAPSADTAVSVNQKTEPGAAPKEGKVYFKNLTGLRSIGAIRVLVGHIEFLKAFWGLAAFEWFPIGGKIGVTFFFALSGFLITALLLQEREITGTVKMKKFYMRRMLRILPLYYLMVLLSIFVFSQIDFLKIPGYTDSMLENLSWANLLIVLLLLPNFFDFHIPYIDQRWSIVVEEQFYLIQPMFIRFLKKRWLLVTVFVLIGLLPEIVRWGYTTFGLENTIPKGAIVAITTQLKYLGCISMGCVFSVLYFRRESKMKQILFTRWVQWGTLAVIFGGILIGYYVYHTPELIDYRLYALLFGLVVFNATLNPNTIFRLEYPILNFLGNISYGIYMLHPVCIGVGLALGSRVTKDPVLQNLIIYPVSVGLTILLAWLSYRYFESYFLKFKKGFSILKFKGGKKGKSVE